MKEKNKWLSFLADGILAGLVLGIGAIALLSCDNRYMGAFLFSLGLYSIVRFKYGLYTGKVGYIVNRDGKYIGETFFTLLANGVGTMLAGFAVRATRLAGVSVSNMDVTIIDRAAATMATKINDGFLSSFLLAVFCGILMFTAVDNFRKCMEDGNSVGSVFGVIMPVVVFIICGFNHCIADLAYYFIAGCPDVGGAAVYFVAAILGNGVGGMIIPLLKKVSNQPL